MRVDVTLTAAGRTTPLDWLGARGPVTWSWDTGGPETCSWEMLTSARLDERMSHALVRVSHRGIPLWTGRLSAPEPGAGSFTATGLRSEISREPALDGASAPTAVPNVAVDQGQLRGLAAGRVADLGSGDVMELSDSAAPTIGQVLDAQCEIAGWFWWRVVPWDHGSPGLVTYTAVDAAPRYRMPAPLDGAPTVLDDEDFSTRVVVQFVDATTGAWSTAQAVDTAAEALLGAPRTTVVDLSGSTTRMDSTMASARAAGILARLGLRSTWTTPLEPGWGEFAAIGGAPTSVAYPLQKVRLLGRSSALDVTIGRSVMSEDAAPLLEPLGMAARDLSAVIADLTEGAAA